MKKIIQKLKQLSEKKKIWIIFGLVFLLSLKLSRFVGQLYEKIIGHGISGWFLGSSCAECFEGFFFSIAFLLPLVYAIVFGVRKIKLYIYIAISPLLLSLLIGISEEFFIEFVLSLTGLTLGQLIYLIRTKLVRS